MITIVPFKCAKTIQKLIPAGWANVNSPWKLFG